MKSIVAVHDPPALTPNAIRTFQETVYRYYRENAREFSWRNTQDPYRILVSEIMLQQTQVERVIAKYEEFLKAFPDFTSLSRADLRELLAVWKGNGYNRRAICLRRAAVRVVEEFGGALPDSEAVLRTFPGIGPATAGAILAFAFHRPSAFIETNIRRVFLHFFFPGQQGVHDKEILPLVEKTLDRGNVRDWYYALMDYGTMLKKKTRNPNRRSAHYRRQARFRDSDREIRGMILQAMLDSPALSEQDLLNAVDRPAARVGKMLKQLIREGFLEQREGMVRISRDGVGSTE